MSWPHWIPVCVSCCFENSQLDRWIIELFCTWLIPQLGIQHNMGNNSIFYMHCFLSNLPNICLCQPQCLETQCYIFSHDSVLHYLFPSVPWTLDLWFDVLLPNSQPISPILLNQYVHWRMFTMTDCGWQKSTQTFAGCPFNNPFVYRGWGDAAGLGDTIPISIKGELSQGWGWNRVHIKRHLYLHVFEIMETVLKN